MTPEEIWLQAVGIGCRTQKAAGVQRYLQAPPFLNHVMVEVRRVMVGSDLNHKGAIAAAFSVPGRGRDTSRFTCAPTSSHQSSAQHRSWNVPEEDVPLRPLRFHPLPSHSSFLPHDSTTWPLFSWHLKSEPKADTE